MSCHNSSPDMGGVIFETWIGENKDDKDCDLTGDPKFHFFKVESHRGDLLTVDLKGSTSVPQCLNFIDSGTQKAEWERSGMTVAGWSDPTEKSEIKRINTKRNSGTVFATIEKCTGAYKFKVGKKQLPLQVSM